jgi:hypothetical protein
MLIHQRERGFQVPDRFLPLIPVPFYAMLPGSLERGGILRLQNIARVLDLLSGIKWNKGFSGV